MLLGIPAEFYLNLVGYKVSRKLLNSSPVARFI